MFRIAAVLLFLCRDALAVMYSINESQYNRMPPLYGMDDYQGCMAEPDAVYCVVHLALSSPAPSDLMHLVKEYSAHTIKHFNHTQIHRAVCATQTCQQYLKPNTQNTTVDLNHTLAECLNESVWKEYQLEAKLEDVEYCIREGEDIKMDISDMIVAVIYLVIMMLNLLGSFYHICISKKDEKPVGNKYLLAFSVQQNWKKMTAASSSGPDPRLNRLKCFHGLRTMTIVCVFFSHTVLIMALSFVENPLYIEKSYEDPLKQILFNGSLVTHTFFVMSAFLLAYNYQLHAETHRPSWTQWPKGMMMRWLRLTPVYALVLATVSTLMRHLGSGPLWRLVVNTEAQACRRYWWAHVFYFNNYVYEDALCAPQTWYLAADTQLFCIGLLVCVCTRTPRARKMALIALFLVSLITPALHTYFQDLSAVVIQTPEAYRSLYAHEDTFRLLYVRGHTNLSTYTLGLAGGFLTYYWQQQGKDLSQTKNLRYVVWLMFPAGVATILSGGLFYADGPRAPLVYRIAYATVYKPVFQMMIVVIIMSCIFKCEKVFRGIIEWRGFTWTGRVSYCAFLIHTLIQRGLVGAQTMPTYLSDYYVLTILSSTIFLSFLLGAALWLLVESPMSQLTKALLNPPRRHLENNMAAAETGDGQSKL